MSLLLSGCGLSAAPEHIRAVRMHALPGCPAETGDMSLTALGDFDPTPTTAEFVNSRLVGKQLGFPDATRAIQAKLSAPHGAWLGSAEEGAPGGDFDIPLWPATQSCELTPAAGSGYPAGAGGQAIGLTSEHGVLLVAGGLTASADSARALSLDIRTGVATEVADGMVPGRAFATVTPFGANLLVAGGVDPRTSSSGNAADGRPLDSAIVYETATGRFDRKSLIPLSAARARHAALVLPSGETLLIGGIDASGQALATLDAISPVDRAPREIGLATLAVPRIDPVALRLDDGRILVAGGVTSAGDPIDRVEYLDADASSAPFKNVSVPARLNRAFVAMPGGAALAVGGCEPAATDCREAWWISPEGVPERLPDLPVQAPHPMLVPATNGAPWLVAGADDARELLRFDPWQARFVVPPTRPALVPSADLPAPVALDDGAFVWIAHTGGGLALRGYRFDTRGRFAFDIAPLLSTLPPQDSFPETQALHVAPDRSPLRAGAGVSFDAASGLHLSGDVATAVVTDATYASLHGAIALLSGPPPQVLLGDRAFGGADCPWPDASGDAGALGLDFSPGSIVLTRGDAATTCTAPIGRFALGFRAAPASETVIRSVTIRRTPR